MHVKLGLPEDYNEAASKVVATQEAFLKRISDIDIVEAVRLKFLFVFTMIPKVFIADDLRAPLGCTNHAVYGPHCCD
jgi:hypothetical protein